MLNLPQSKRQLASYIPGKTTPLQVPRGIEFSSRIAYSAAHVIVDPLDATDFPDSPVIDFEATVAYRRHLWSLGLGVAEAMDTAQRGMGLDWTSARELIRHSCAEAKVVGARIACGANTDQLSHCAAISLDHVVAAYEEQLSFIEEHGGRVILMASRSLASAAKTQDDYKKVYGRILSQARYPVILHWLGQAFDPSLAGYWGSASVDIAMETCLEIISAQAPRVDGIKISLLDKAREIEMRRRLPSGVRMYTGDDFHYDELIEGDDAGHSDALLGIFDAIAPAASLAMQALDRNDLQSYRRFLGPTLPLSRHIFRKPTYFYKTGLVFLSYLNGHQNHFRMIGGQESARSIIHLSEVFTLADEAGLLPDPEQAAARFRPVLVLAGIAQP